MADHFDQFLYGIDFMEIIDNTIPWSVVIVQTIGVSSRLPLRLFASYTSRFSSIFLDFISTIVCTEPIVHRKIIIFTCKMYAFEQSNLICENTYFINYIVQISLSFFWDQWNNLWDGQNLLLTVYSSLIVYNII